MSNRIDIDELLENGIISAEVAGDIHHYYDNKKSNRSSSLLLVIFGVLGAILIGSGVMLILAHNWGQLPKLLKTVLAFIPLISGQLLCAYTLKRKADNIAWRESTAIFLALAIGACIALISQIYHIEGEMHSFLLTWMLLALPIVYLMRSSVTSIFYIVGTFYYATFSYTSKEPLGRFLIYLLTMLFIFPFYYNLIRSKINRNLTSIHHYFVPFSLIAGTVLVFLEGGHYASIGIISLFGIFYMIGHYLQATNHLSLFKNGYLIIGAIGTIGMLMFFSFEWFFDYHSKEIYKVDGEYRYAILAASGLFVAAVIGLFAVRKVGSYYEMPALFGFLVFSLLFLFGKSVPGISQLVINILIMMMGVMTVKRGIDYDHLGILNYGLLIITVLMICRFFDVELSFIIRGMLFIAVGIAFFATNRFILQKRTNHAE